MAVWINEFHYDNTSTDIGEFIEVAGTAGTNLSGWSLVLYNGNPTQRVTYNTIALSGVIDNEQNGFGAVSFALAVNGLQNGGFPGTNLEPDGIALVNGTTVVQFLSYEGSATTGTFTALNGPAAGLTSVNIGVGIAEVGTEPAGLSLQLIGSGDEAADFTWTGPVAQSPGSINVGQSFPPPAADTVSISDASVTEGDAGTTLLTFTISRTTDTGSFSVDVASADGTATTADGDYVSLGTTVAFTAGGALSQQVSVTINGDTAVELDETLTVTLSNLVNTVGTTTILDGTGTGTILNDDVVLTEIGTIQGAGHKAPSVGGAVGSSGNSGATRFNVEGVVTAITTNGFWIQDADGDGDLATSDGIFVFTSSAPAGTIEIGETVQLLNVQVNEFRFNSATNNLTVTQLTASTGTLVELGGFTAITPVVLGVDRMIPTGQVSDAGFASFDPATDAIDFWESLEGMLVTIPESIATSPTSEFRTRDPANSANAEGPPTEEIWVRLPGNTGPGTLTDAGGFLLGATDDNPERIQIDDLTSPVDLPDVTVGDTLSAVTGVVSYDFANYEVLVPTAPTITTPGGTAKETTALTADLRQVSIATYNVLNLDPVVESTAAGAVAGGDLYTRLGNSDDDIGNGRYAGIAFDIAVALGAPTIVALQEIQDSDGATISSVLDATLTLQTLVDLIETTYGIDYAFAEVAPSASNINGGQPNANIRNAYLYRADQVELVDAYLLADPDPAEADLLPGDDLFDTRKPLVGEFLFNGVEFTVVNNHFNSKSGDGGIFGNQQPPLLPSEDQRIETAKIVNDFVEALEAGDKDAKAIVLGDLNEFQFRTPFLTLTGTGKDQVLFDLAAEFLDPEDIYSFNFQGNAQALDHILANELLLEEAAIAYDAVHRNADFSDGASDHDPLLALLDFREFAEDLLLSDANDTLDGAGGNDTVDGGIGRDLLIGGAGRDRLNGSSGSDTLDGGAGNDRMNGGSGDNVIVYGLEGGKDRVTGFDVGADRIDLQAWAALGIEEFADLTLVPLLGGSVRIDFGGNNLLDLLNVALGDLSASDFIFA